MLLGLDPHSQCRFENLEWNPLEKKADTETFFWPEKKVLFHEKQKGN